MKVEYSAKFLADFSSIAAYYAGFSDPTVSERVMARIHEVVARVLIAPESGRRVANRPDVRVVPLLSYPYVISTA
jgi:plasmid stabilization system protein ParE